MSEIASEPVRRGLLIRAALQVLSEAGGPVPRAEVIRLVEQRVQLTPYESAPFRVNDSLPRWENHLTWASTDMKASGWIEKAPLGWLITDAGREALATHPDDGAGLDVESGQAYRDTRRPDATETPRYREF